ncbi:MBL fold metallo-hydrolase [Pseudorhodoplanes sinuspersici]|nr:MBL fold metallo-hydrolase [Pseudorhodoplanes sinuspersici]RKE73175.1 glyoxylase-like metal-dependent hydrolase (beta-lactamase superfamily II) [Pseudorhodoplanes sinuspersici]
MIIRRHFIAAGSAASLISASGLRAREQPSTGPMQQAPAHYRIPVGETMITALCDGYLDLPHALFPAATDERAGELARKAFLRPGPIPTAVNAFALESGDRLVLIDAGVGPLRGESTGRLRQEMQLASLDPARVSAVLLTHLHTDHCGGLLDATGERAFPNAEVFVSEPELRFWTDGGLPSRAPEAMQPMIRIANAVLRAYGNRVTSFGPGAEPISGIRSVPIFGHTPGHTGFIIGSGDDAVFIWGDVVHVAPFQFAQPEWGLSFDVDQAAASATRRRIFAQVASDRMRIAGMHLAFPGVGHVVRDTTSYHYVPSPWRPLG